MRLGVARALVDGMLVDGDIEVVDGRIAAVGLGVSGHGTAAPGFVDLQVNGFAGVDLVTADRDAYAHVGAAMAATGVTAYQPTFITGDPAGVVQALERLAALLDDPLPGPRILGAHVEGPFLSPARAGTHPPERLLDPDPELLDRFLAAGPVREVTLAPELPGGLDAIETLTAAGVLVACGHTDADTAVARAAFDRGARSVTHLFNAMRPLHHRDPGVAGVALTRPDVAVPIIVDGVHLAAEIVRLVFAAAPDRAILVTDATAAAGMPDGEFDLGEVRLRKHGLEVRRADGTLAGSALTMDAAVRNVVDVGVDLPAALTAASTTPDVLLGGPAVGLRPGGVADVVVLDDDLHVTRVLRDGEVLA
jgi:N-acetylglucosamine-6-phosphate deacetylase